MSGRTRLIVCTALLLSLTACSKGQTDVAPQAQKQPEQPATKLEAFLGGKHGKLLIKDSYAVGRVGTLSGHAEMDALVIYEPEGSQKIKGLRIEVTEGGRLERSSVSFIDIDELQSLSEALSYMWDLASKWAGPGREPYTEVTYSSKGNFKVGFYEKGRTMSGFLSSGLISPVTAFVNVSDLQTLKTSVDNTVSLLNGK